MNNTLHRIMEQSELTEAGETLQNWMRETARRAFLHPLPDAFPCSLSSRLSLE